MTRRKGRQLFAPATLERVASCVAGYAVKQGVKVALAGGLAMQYYGSDRMTGDVDLLADAEFNTGLKCLGRLTFGGLRYITKNGVPVDVIVRSDEHSELYAVSRALAQKSEMPSLPIVRPEHLAAMKFGAGRPKDQDDLLFLLQTMRRTEVKAARDIVYRFLGGRFARDEFDCVIDEAAWRKRRTLLGGRFRGLSR